MGNRMTMPEARAECARLGITPGRSLAECERRLAQRAKHEAALAVGVCATQTGADGVRRVVSLYDEVTHVAVDEAAPEVGAPPSPRMSRTMRLLCASTALFGPTLASNPRVFCGDPVMPWPRGA